MSSPPARPAGTSPGGRHAAPRRAGPRPLLAGLAVLLVVLAAGLVVTRLTGDAPPSAGPAPDRATARATADEGSGDEVAPAPTDGRTGAPSAEPPVPASSGSVPAPGGPEVLPGAPIPGPGAPRPPGDDVVPTSLRVPTIGVDVPLAGLGLQPDGSIEVPADADDAGWLTASAVPGRTGPAVVAGHVDSATGVAVFTRLSELASGDPVEVGLSDGTVVRFVVTDSERYPKDAFPSADVYGPVPAPALRLITCGGVFDRAEGSYEDNLVVYAVPA